MHVTGLIRQIDAESSHSHAKPGIHRADGDAMDIRKVKKLIELLEESNINEIEIKEGEESVRISRGGQVEIGRAHV